MTAGRRFAARAALLLCLAPFCATAAEVVDKGKRGARKPAPAIATPEEVAADPAGVWARFMARADLETAYDAFDVLDAIGATAEGVDPALCRDQASALRDAVKAAPISIAVHREALRCAEATGDDATAERESAALAALSKHALAGAGGNAWQTPIRVLSPRDVYHLLALLGYEFRYEYYRDLHPGRYFPLVVAVWDAEAKIERHLSFDYVDATAVTSRSDDYAGYPFQRHVMAAAFMRAQANSGETAGVDLKAVRDALATDDLQARREALREGASRGGMLSLSAWLALCIGWKDAGCSDGLIDALLPLAERKHAMPMVLLATAYANGVGVKRDLKAADALLDAADRLWYGHGASVRFAAADSLMHENRSSPFALARLRKAVAAGSADAEMLLVATRLAEEAAPTLSEAEIAVLQRPGNNGQGLGHATLGEYFDKRGLRQRSEEAFRKAASLGHPGSQRVQALGLMRADQPALRWRPLLESAAQAGDVFAMRMLAAEAMQLGQWTRADGWLLAAVEMGDREASLEQAVVYASGADGLSGDLADAVAMLETLAEGDDEAAAGARRRLARMSLEGQGMKRSRQRAHVAAGRRGARRCRIADPARCAVAADRRRQGDGCGCRRTLAAEGGRRRLQSCAQRIRHVAVRQRSADRRPPPQRHRGHACGRPGGRGLRRGRQQSRLAAVRIPARGCARSRRRPGGGEDRRRQGRPRLGRRRHGRRLLRRQRRFRDRAAPAAARVRCAAARRRRQTAGQPRHSPAAGAVQGAQGLSGTRGGAVARPARRAL